MSASDFPDPPKCAVPDSAELPTRLPLDDVRLPTPTARTVAYRVAPDRQETPNLSPDTAPGEGRWPVVPGYRILGELGRGGMGAVLKGHDLTLDRAVAIKILHTTGDVAGLAQRFVAEAQIAGQLQHPGTAPVYHLGILASGLPFFAMKLVEGKTLAKLLKAREMPQHDLPRFVNIFEQVCQAVAYAHSRGIIHRDLKPLNIMVGAFGEVQVMDWGLARVLNRDDIGPDPNRPQATDEIARTQAGAVLGTPAYMPPEQARGETDRLDARCDVFALGSILCEIVTGQPTYRGPTALVVLLRATEADLTDAFNRLDGSGADAELVALAKDCLAAERDERPRDAKAVADRVLRYTNGVQEKLRAAEIDKAAAEARAEEAKATATAERAKTQAERRTRRALAALGGVLLLGLAGVAALYGRAEHLRRQAESSELLAAAERDAADQARAKTREAWTR